MKKLVSALALGVAVSMVGLTIATDAMALPDYSIERSYYSDATYSTVTGEWSRECSGFTHSWGAVTPYYIDIQDPCPLSCKLHPEKCLE